MNEQILELWNTACAEVQPEMDGICMTNQRGQKFAQLIVAECSRRNKAESFELLGVIADVEADNGFDEVCLNTVKRVHQYLSSDALEQHFGVDE